MPRAHSAVFVTTIVLAATACASRPAAAPEAPGAGAAAAPAAAPAARDVGRPLAGLAGEHVVVLPAQRVRVTGGAAPAVASGIGGEALARLDSAITAAVGERGVSWAFAEDVLRSARRNPTYAADPRRLAVGALMPGRRPAPDNAIGDPLASQLRTLVALNDARYVLVPAEVRLEPAGAGAARAVLHVALVDARGSQLRWAGDVAGDAAPPDAGLISSAAAATLAARLADLIAAP